MQALRHGARQALRARVVTREPCITFARPCSSEAAATRVHMSKSDRQQLVSQFVEKFKAANNGTLPTITLLRKEIGGSHYVIKEILQTLENNSDDQVACEKASNAKKSKTSKSDTNKKDPQLVEGAPQKAATATKDGSKRISSSKTVNSELAANMPDPHDKYEMTDALSKSNKHEEEEVPRASALQGERYEEEMRKGSQEMAKGVSKRQPSSKKDKSPVQDKKSAARGVKQAEEIKSVKQTKLKTTSASAEQQNQSPLETEDTLASLMDTITTDEDNDDDSDVAAPEYQQTLMMQIKEGRAQAAGSDLNAKSVVNGKNDDQTVSLGSRLKEDNKLETMQKGLSAVKGMIQSMAKPAPDLSFGSTIRPPTTVLRVVNLPNHVSALQLRSACESIARVHAVHLRRGRIADVHFDVDLREMNNVLDRLRKMVLGSTILKVYPALRFSCETNSSSRFVPRNVQELKHMRNSLIHAFEQRFKFLCFQVQDFRDLHNLKAAR